MHPSITQIVLLALLKKWVLWSTTYPPDLNPIEEAFSKVKSFLKANDTFIQIADESEIPDIILSGFASITSSDCQGWMEYSGY